MINDGYKYNFEQLKIACQNDDLALVECTERDTGKPAILLCAIFLDENEQYNMVPMARMIDGDPYEMFNPPEVKDETHND